MAVTLAVTKYNIKVGNKVQQVTYDSLTDIVVDGDIVYLPSGSGSIAINTKTGASFENSATVGEVGTALSATDLT